MRPIITVALALVLAIPAAAQTTTATAPQTSTAPQASAAVPPATRTLSGDPAETREQTRQEFGQLLARHPDQLTRLLVLDPTLLDNQPFLARYPEVAQFVADHPAVRNNPHYYLERQEGRVAVYHEPSGLSRFAEMLSVMFVVGAIISALVWLIRTVVEQKRWSQLSRRQTEVHTKILDRLGSSEELLAYIKSPAGTKYLESAPIALHAAAPAPRTPLSRALRSVQIGIVVAAAGVGLLIVSGHGSEDARQGFFAMGAVAACIGGGFILSALVSFFVSRRMETHDGNGGSMPGGVAEDGGLMR